MGERTAVVIGAGVGGLTAAAALHRAGWHVRVLERAPSLEPVGAGIALAPNAQRALDRIGLGDTVRALRSWTSEGGLRTPSGRWLSRTSNEAAAARYGGPLVLLHRAQLLGMLREMIPEDAVTTGAEAEITDPGGAGRPARVRTADGDVTAHLLVAADGIRSAARDVLFPGHPAPRYAGFTTWRIVVPAPRGPFAPHETWGRGLLWGSQPLPDGRVYAYAAAALPPGERAPDGERAELLRRFGTWHDPVPELIRAAAPDGVLRNDVYAMAAPLPALHRGRTALLGDAAHAMPPSLGQGGNQAIEDAIVLAHHASAPESGPAPTPESEPDPEAAVEGLLRAYTRDRLPRTSEVVRRSSRVARMTTLTSAPACAARNAAMALVNRFGPGLALRALDGVADWSPPGHAYAAGHVRREEAL
ncbi:FAD-dependent monooxygenase [Streptomyces sp. ODS28]|uniref:FAD-dependent monooxygenase n=1 Tax=Streptomyces sp. ODS28 TaxID=3136688 RepID=UPI0031EDA853